MVWCRVRAAGVLFALPGCSCARCAVGGAATPGCRTHRDVASGGRTAKGLFGVVAVGRCANGAVNVQSSNQMSAFLTAQGARDARPVKTGVHTPCVHAGGPQRKCCQTLCFGTLHNRRALCLLAVQLPVCTATWQAWADGLLKLEPDGTGAAAGAGCADPQAAWHAAMVSLLQACLPALADQGLTHCIAPRYAGVAGGAVLLNSQVPSLPSLDLFPRLHYYLPGRFWLVGHEGSTNSSNSHTRHLHKPSVVISWRRCIKVSWLCSLPLLFFVTGCSHLTCHPLHLQAVLRPRACMQRGSSCAGEH